MRRAHWLAVIGLGLLCAAILVFLPLVSGGPGAPVVINETAVPPVPTLNAQAVAPGQSLYAQHCAGCHGANLEGQTNWKEPLADGSFPSPPHDNTGHTWHHPDELLISIILNGGDPAYNSKMPAFADKLTQAEARQILEFIKSHWGQDEREFQWWITSTGTQ